MPDEYSEAIDEFHKVYIPISRKYNLRKYSKVSIFEDSIIEIYKNKGDAKEYIIRLKESDSILMYRRAREEIINYDRKQRTVSG